jgi:hypothetical protein
MFERRTEPLLHWTAFLRRVAISAGLGVFLILVSLSAGMAGYHYFESLS